MSVYRFGEFVLDSETHELLRSGQPRHLSAKAFRLLEALVSSRPRVWSKSKLQDLLWPETVVVEANLPNLVAEVRAVLEVDFWLLDIAALRPVVTEARGLAEQVGRQDLAAEALGWLGRAEQADGNLEAATGLDRRAFAHLPRSKSNMPDANMTFPVFQVFSRPDAISAAVNAIFNESLISEAHLSSW
jgi:hypothetical protein